MKKTLLGIVLGCLVSDAWAYSAADYKQEGLLNQWDAIENAGPYRHDANATVWKDLAGGKTVYGSRDLELTENGSWGDGWLNVNGLSAVGSDKTTDYKTIEIVLARRSQRKRSFPEPKRWSARSPARLTAKSVRD